MSAKRSSVKLHKGAPPKAPRLKDRRRQGRRRVLIAFAALAVAFFGAIAWGANQPGLRISSIEFNGGDALLPGAEPVALAKSALQGTYLFGLIPRDSTLFYPSHQIRAAIIQAHPEIAALSISHTGLRGLLIKASTHTAVGRWCGLGPTAGVTPYCYLYDPNGFVYAATPDPLGGDASSTPSAPALVTVNSFALYAPLVKNAQEPLRATIVHAEQLPDAAALARQLATFGSEVQSVVIHEDEADLYLASGTRVSYVLGHEQEVYTALISATTFRKDMNLANGSLEYVDLRFPGKLYLKKKNDSVSQ